jgi:hypothetical protein
VAREIVITLIALLTTQEGRVKKRIVGLSIYPAAGDVGVEVGAQGASRDGQLFAHGTLVETVGRKQIRLRPVFRRYDPVRGLKGPSPGMAPVIELGFAVASPQAPFHIFLSLVAQVRGKGVGDLVEVVKGGRDGPRAIGRADEVGIPPVRGPLLAVAGPDLVANRQ